VSDAAAIIDALGCGQCTACTLASRRGHGFVHCPAHPDRHASLSIDARRDKVLFHCWAGCEQRAVVDGLRGLGLWRSR